MSHYSEFGMVCSLLVISIFGCARNVSQDQEDHDTSTFPIYDRASSDTISEQIAPDHEFSTSINGEMPDWTIDWAVQAGGAQDLDAHIGDVPFDISVTPTGDFYVTGFAESATSTFGAGTANEIQLVKERDGAIFLVHYHKDGTLQWLRPIAVAAELWDGQSVNYASDGGVIVSGRFMGHAGQVVFGHGTEQEQVNTSDCGDCPFIVRYSTEGDFDWVKVMETGDQSVGRSLTSISLDGSICFATTFTFGFELAPGIAMPDPAPGTGSVVVARLSADGTPQWARQISGAEAIALADIAALPNNGCAVLYSIDGKGAVESTDDVINVTVKGEWGAFVAAFDSMGTVSWNSDLGVVGENWSSTSHAGALFVAEEQIIIGHPFNGILNGPDTTYFSPAETNDNGGRSHFISQLENDGSVAWVSPIIGIVDGDSEARWSVNYGVLDINRLQDGTLVLAGVFQHMSIFGYGSPAAVLLQAVSQGNGHSSFIAGWSWDGQPLWARQLGSGANDFMPNIPCDGPIGDSLRAIDISEEPAIYMAGSFVDTIDLGANDEEFQTLTSWGGLDIFLAKLLPVD